MTVGLGALWRLCREVAPLAQATVKFQKVAETTLCIFGQRRCLCALEDTSSDRKGYIIYVGGSLGIQCNSDEASSDDTYHGKQYLRKTTTPSAKSQKNLDRHSKTENGTAKFTGPKGCENNTSRYGHCLRRGGGVQR